MRDGVVAIVKNMKGDVLVGKRIHGQEIYDHAGGWDLPGVMVENGESDAAALRREIKRIAGIDIGVGRRIGVRKSCSGKVLGWYECFAERAVQKYLLNNVDYEALCWSHRENVTEMCGREVTEIWPEAVRDYFPLQNIADKLNSSAAVS